MRKDQKLMFGQIDIVYFLIRIAGVAGVLVWMVGSQIPTKTFYIIYGLIVMFFTYSVIFYLINLRFINVMVM